MYQGTFLVELGTSMRVVAGWNPTETEVASAIVKTTYSDYDLFYPSFFYVSQLRVQASDGGTPPRTSVVPVTVHVNRNLRCPQWVVGGGDNRILETLPLGEPVFVVEASDRDDKVSGHW